MSDQINVALVGLGFGAEFIPIYQKHPHTTIAGVVSETKNRLSRLGTSSESMLPRLCIL